MGEETQEKLHAGSHWDKIKKEWRLVGSDIITCSATDEQTDKPSCQSSCKGKGCSYLKDGKCTYGEENNG